MKNLEIEYRLGIKQSSYFPCPPIQEFDLGQMVKSDLNQDNEFSDVCVIEGIRFDRDDGIWIYRLRMLMSLTRWHEIDKLSFKSNDEMEVSANFILPLTVEDLEEFTRCCDRYLLTPASLF
jgi:hypothetical protein